MNEKRKAKRSNLNVSVQIHKCDREDKKSVNVQVQDLSKSGIGFVTNEILETGEYYDADITIWTKEVIKSVIKIVRVNPKGDTGLISYGSEFVGLSEMEKFRIDVYQCVEEYKN